MLVPAPARRGLRLLTAKPWIRASAKRQLAGVSLAGCPFRAENRGWLPADAGCPWSLEAVS